MKKKYVQPILFLATLPKEDVVRASALEDGDHIVKPGSNWGSGTSSKESWSGWF